MSVAGELLEAARGLLRKGRSDGAEARDADDTPIDPTHEDAAKFSIYGALRRAAYDRRDSTGLDTALMLLGVNDLQDPRMEGLNRALEDDALDARFEEAIARANGGPVKARSLDAERRMLDPRDPDYLRKVRELERRPEEREAAAAEDSELEKHGAEDAK